MRPACCGLKAHDIDCENGDYRLIASGAELIGCAGLVPSVSDYIEHRDEYLAEICAQHGCETGVAKRLPNIVGKIICHIDVCESLWSMGVRSDQLKGYFGGDPTDWN